MRDEVLYEVFLDLKRAYDALDWERCLEILVAYGVGTRKERLLCKYWGGGITMVSRAGQYYGALFMVSRGITQG